MSEKWEAARLDEIDEFGGGDWPLFRPVRRHFGVGSFGVNVWRAAGAGQDIIQPHTELGSLTLGHEELYFVLAGHAKFDIDGESVDAPAGTFVFVRHPGAVRSASALEAETTVLALGGEPGKPYEVGPWEWGYLAFLALLRGEGEEAKRLCEEALAHFPDHPRLLYRLACAQEQLGEREAARTSLARAIELQPDLLERARNDPDLAGVVPELPDGERG